MKSNSNVFLNVIPVEVVTCGKSIMTYAFLDQGSTTSLCDKRLLDQLQVSGEPAKFSISTVNEQTLRQGCKVNLTVCSLAGDETLVLRDVLSVDRLPVSPNPSLSSDELKAWPHLPNVSFPVVQGEVLLLIGLNAPEAFWVAEERRGATAQPYAVRTTLGWSIVGPKFIGNQESSVSVNFVSTSEQLINSQIECLWRLDSVPSRQSYDTSMSKEDRYVLQLSQNSKSVVDGHYQVALPWRPGAPQLKNNYEQARVRLSYLKRRLMKDSSLKSRYVDAVSSYISQVHAEQVEPELESDTKWYLPHHPVLHPHKPKIRVVFDCGAEFAGNSLNSQLLKDPDFMSSLIGELTRFRKENVAVVGDIKEMFHQVFVDPKDRQYLRFLWWAGGDLTSETVTHQMNVHLFGATSSPACAQFSLLQASEDQKNEFDDEVRQLIRRNFYMDDCLFSAPTIGEAARLVREVSELLRKRGFQLTKWISNCSSVLQSIPRDSQVKSKVNLTSTDLSERVLGVQWDLKGDCFKFELCLKEKPVTRRGILSAVSSLFDPLGFAAPVVLTAKLLLQDLCRRKFAWDEALPCEDEGTWIRWLEDLQNLAQVTVPRCLIRSSLRYSDLQTQLHHFSDASSVGYSTVSYLRVIAPDDSIFCSFLMGKSRLAPIKTVSIPRLELVAATMASRVDTILRRELDGLNGESFFWTDSLVVIYMIRNTSKRLPVFVSNRLSEIEEASNPNQWHYVESACNPADDGTRVTTVNQSLGRWLSGPIFLQESRSSWPRPPCDFPDLPEEFAILKRPVAMSDVVTCPTDFEQRFARFSSFYRLKRAVAWTLRLRNKWLKRSTSGSLTEDEIEKAEIVIISTIQREFYLRDYELLKSDSSGKAVGNSLKKLCPIYLSGVLRVGGRLRRGTYELDVKHPIIMPPDSHVTRLLIEEYYRNVGHSGTSHTWTSRRQRFWIAKGAGTVRKVLGACLFCKRRNVSFGVQYMADLPLCRVTSGNAPFYFTGIDFFGPIMVKQNRSQVKRYGCVFTCLKMRAVHLEVGFSLETDAFINVLRRFINRRGKPHMFYSDNGTNIVGGYKELRRSLQELNQSVIEEQPKQQQIRWNFNPPYASHMGGI